MLRLSHASMLSTGHHCPSREYQEGSEEEGAYRPMRFFFAGEAEYSAAWAVDVHGFSVQVPVTLDCISAVDTRTERELTAIHYEGLQGKRLVSLALLFCAHFLENGTWYLQRGYMYRCGTSEPAL